MKILVFHVCKDCGRIYVCRFPVSHKWDRCGGQFKHVTVMHE